MRKSKLILAVVLIALLLPAIWLNTRTGITIHDQFLFLRASGEYRSLSGWNIDHDPSADLFTTQLADQTYRASAEVNGDFLRFDFGDGTIVEGRWDKRFGLVDPDGIPVSLFAEPVIITGGDTLRFHSSPHEIACELSRIVMGKTESFGSLSLVLCGILLYLLGAAHFLWPEQTHFLFSRWRYRAAELSDEGIAAERIGAVLLLLCAAGVMFAPLFA